MNEPETENVTTQGNGSGDAATPGDAAPEAEAVAEVETAETETAETETAGTETPAGETGEGAPKNPEFRWYVATTYSGFENKVKAALAERIRQHRAEEKFGEILIPSESVTEQTKAGKTRVKTKTSFPGAVGFSASGTAASTTIGPRAM